MRLVPLALLTVLVTARCGDKEPVDTAAPQDTGAPGDTGAPPETGDTDTAEPADSQAETAVQDDCTADTSDTGEREPLSTDELQVGDLIVTEFMAEPCSSQAYWVELRNTLDRDVDLYGLQVGRRVFIGSRHTIPAGGTFTIARNDSWTSNYGVYPDLEDSDFVLDAEGDSLDLSVDGLVIDALRFDSGWFADRHLGRAIALDPSAYDATANDDPGAWCYGSHELRASSNCTAYGSPGDDNEACDHELGDRDADGWYGDDDCDDEDAGVNPDATETCDDGLDNDCDALVDCEDGGCAGVGSCGEVLCHDGLDDDADGLTDCDDDDCWGGECHPAGVKVQARGGHFTLRQDAETRWGIGPYYWSTSAWDCRGFHRRTSTGTMQVTGLHGVVQVLPSGAAWSTTSARTSCSWSVDTAWRSQQWLAAFDHYRGGSSWSATLARSGFHIESGCRVAGSWFLPPRPWRIGEVVYGDYLGWGGSLFYAYSPWYQLRTTTGTSWQHTSTTTNVCGTRTSASWGSSLAGELGSSLSPILVVP